MPPDAVVMLVGARHHGDRIPADHAADALLDFLVARERGFLLRRDGIDVGSLYQFGDADIQHARAFQHASDEELGTALAVEPHDVVQSINPLLRFGRIAIGQLLLEVRDQDSLHQIFSFYGIYPPLQDLSPRPGARSEMQ